MTDRFEWFWVDYRGSIYVPKAGEYLFSLGSDDGSKLYIDDQVVIDFDRVHGYGEKDGKVTVTQGTTRSGSATSRARASRLACGSS